MKGAPECSPIAELCRDCGYWREMCLYLQGLGPEPDRSDYGPVYNVFMESEP